MLLEEILKLLLTRGVSVYLLIEGGEYKKVDLSECYKHFDKEIIAIEDSVTALSETMGTLFVKIESGVLFRFRILEDHDKIMYDLIVKLGNDINKKEHTQLMDHIHRTSVLSGNMLCYTNRYAAFEYGFTLSMYLYGARGRNGEDLSRLQVNVALCSGNYLVTPPDHFYVLRL